METKALHVRKRPSMALMETLIQKHCFVFLNFFCSVIIRANLNLNFALKTAVDYSLAYRLKY